MRLNRFSRKGHPFQQANAAGNTVQVFGCLCTFIVWQIVDYAVEYLFFSF